MFRLNECATKGTGEALHVALRKCCNSPATSLVWNLLYLIEPSEYNTGLQKAIAAANPGSRDALRVVVRDYSTGEGDRPAWATTHGLAALWCAFRLFDDVDWDGYVEYLYEEG